MNKFIELTLEYIVNNKTEYKKSVRYCIAMVMELQNGLAVASLTKK